MKSTEPGEGGLGLSPAFQMKDWILFLLLCCLNGQLVILKSLDAIKMFANLSRFGHIGSM